MVIVKTLPVRGRSRECIVVDQKSFYVACDLAQSDMVIAHSSDQQFFLFFNVFSMEELLTRLRDKCGREPCVIYSNNSAMLPFHDYAAGLWIEHPTEGHDVALCRTAEDEFHLLLSSHKK